MLGSEASEDWPPQEPQQHRLDGVLPEGQEQRVLLERQDPTLAVEPTEPSGKGVRSVALEDQEILRATSIKTALHKGAVIFQDSAGTEETYLQSNAAERIDVFVSHNWAVPRWAKFWALTLHFNVFYAAVVSYAGVGLGCLLNTLKVPPALQEYVADMPLVMRPYCLIFGSCTFFLALLLGHDLPLVGNLACRRRLFLDKVCIHQTNADLKAAGIRNLGAFLRHSDRMLVLFHSLYVKKLWTVYELACFMCLNGREKLDLLPLGIAKVALQITGVAMILQGFLVVSFHFGSLIGVGEAVRISVTTALAGLSFVPVTFILRTWALQRSVQFESLRSFKISEAQCANESDRPIVSSNICSFVRAMGLAQEDTSDAEALLSFDRLVQAQMPELLRSAVGRAGMPYKYAVLAGTVIGYYACDMISSQPDPPAAFVLGWLLYAFNLQTGVIPLGFLISAWMCGKYPPLRKWPELAFKLGTSCLATTAMMLTFVVTDFLFRKALLDPWWLLPHALVSVAEMATMAKLF